MSPKSLIPVRSLYSESSPPADLPIQVASAVSESCLTVEKERKRFLFFFFFL